MRLEQHVRTSATPAQVWRWLEDPRIWSSFELSLRGVRGAGQRVMVGERLMALVRLSTVGIPVDVLEVVPGKRLVLLVHTAPGLREQVACDLVPSVHGGTDIRLSVVLGGPFAMVAAAPLWVARGLTARVLAARTDREARRQRRAAA